METVPYAKISSSIYYVNSETSINLVVNLMRIVPRKNGANTYIRKMRRDVQYIHPTGGFKVRNISLNFDYHLEIKCESKTYGAGFVMLGPEDLYVFRQALQVFGKRYMTNEDSLYEMREGKLVVKTDHPIGICIDELLYGNINIDAGVYRDLDGNLQRCINMILPDNHGEPCVTHILKRKFFGLIEIIKNMDLYLYAQSLVNYYGAEDEIEVYDIHDKQVYDGKNGDRVSNLSSIVEPKVDADYFKARKKTKSFFDMPTPLKKKEKKNE